MTKPRVLILMHYMELGGAESALLGLLQSWDAERADLDVFIYSHRGELMEFIPHDRVNLLPEVEAYSLTEKPLAEVVSKGHLALAAARMIGRWQSDAFTNAHPDPSRPCECGTFFQQRATWRVLPKINPSVTYDLAISFLTPHFILLNRVNARKKVGWIHTDYTRIQVDINAELKMWSRLDKIAVISEEAGNRFCDVFPSLRSKVTVIENILNKDFIIKRSLKSPVTLCDDKSVTTLLTIGRYSVPKKMEDIPHTCHLILERGENVKWYIIGYGSPDIEQTVRNEIAKYHLENHVILLGKKDNPYPYIAACDIYVQPSRYEGKSITVREAQILARPVIITAYPTAPSQVIDGIDGIIVPLDVEECAAQMADFIADKRKQSEIAQYLRTHDYGNESEITKIYDLIE